MQVRGRWLGPVRRPLGPGPTDPLGPPSHQLQPSTGDRATRPSPSPTSKISTRPLLSRVDSDMSDSITVGSYSLRKRGGAASSPTGPAPVRVGNAATTSKREGADKAGIDNGTTSSPPSSRQAQPAKESDTALSESTLSPVGDSPGRRELEREPEGGRPPLAARKPTNKRPKREFSGDSTETEVDDEDEDDEYVEGGGASRGGTSSRKKSTKQRRTSIDHTSPTTRHPPVGHQAQLSTHSPINHRKSLPQPGRHPSRRSGEYSDQGEWRSGRNSRSGRSQLMDPPRSLAQPRTTHQPHLLSHTHQTISLRLC